MDGAARQQPPSEIMRRLRGSLWGLTPAQRQSRRLNDDIAGRASASDILLMCGRYEAQFNAVHYVTALHRVAKAPDGGEMLGQAGMADLLGRVVGLLGLEEHGLEEPTQHLSNTAWALAVLPLHDAPLWAAISA